MASVYVTNLVINCGADFSQTFTLESATGNTPYNLTDHSIAAKLKKHSGSSSSVSFTASIINPISGNIRLQLSATQSAAIKPGRYVYDIVVTNTNSSLKTRVVEGMVLVREGVTT